MQLELRHVLGYSYDITGCPYRVFISIPLMGPLTRLLILKEIKWDILRWWSHSVLIASQMPLSILIPLRIFNLFDLLIIQIWLPFPNQLEPLLLNLNLILRRYLLVHLMKGLIVLVYFDLLLPDLFLNNPMVFVKRHL